MSDFLYPDLPGIGIEVTKMPGFSTKVQRAVSGNEARASFQAYPLWTFKLSYDVLRAGAEKELQTLVGFFGARKGAFDSFLFVDPDDYTVTDQPIGLGDNSNKDFFLSRTFGSGTGATFDEPVHNPRAIINIKVDGVATTDYVLVSTGKITLVSAPALNAVVTWSGRFAYRCRFVNDEQDFDRFLQDLWKAGKVELIGSPMNKIQP